MYKTGFSLRCWSCQHVFSNSGREHWNDVKRILKYLLGTSDLNITFGDKKKLLVSYTDSNMSGDIVYNKSTSGYLATFADEDVA